MLVIFICGALAAPAAEFTEGYLPKFTRTVPPAERDRVELRLDFPPELELDSWPVTFGVPFPRGALRDWRRTRVVDAAGQVVPSQRLRTATWAGPDGDVKWLLVDIDARKGARYFLEFGQRVPAVPPVAADWAKEDAESITIDTGPLRVRVSKRHSHLIESAWLSGKQILAARERMWMVDQQGTRYDTSDDPADYQVGIETSGPRRVVIKAEGWYRNAQGEGLCQYVTRLHLYRGKPFARVIHTLVVAFDTDQTWLREVAVPFDLVGRANRAVYATGEGFSAPVFEAPVPSRLVQGTAERFFIAADDGKTLHEGQRVGGWVNAVGPSGGVAVALRNMWQEYQKELEARPDAVVAHLWPAHSSRMLDFRAPSVYGPERYERLDGEYWRNWYKGGLDQYDQAIGLAKTNEIILAFHGPEAAPARAACAALEKPPFVVADPVWMCKTDVFGPLHPRDPKRYPKIERIFDIAFSRYELLREHLGNYGFFDYGDVNYVVNWDEENQRYWERPWRRMASRFYGISVMPWVQFARTGNRRFLRWAMDNCRHVMDIDMAHVTARVPGYPYPKYKGGRFGGNGGIIHYGANIYDIGCDSHVTPWLYSYYLTGYRRAWDVFQEEGDFYLKLNEAGWRPSGIWTRYAHRMTGGALRVMIQYWWATWDQRYLDKAHILAELCYEAAAESNGVIRHDDVYMNWGLFTYYQATGDERMKEICLANMRKVQDGTIVLGDPRAHTFYGPAMAYYFTGDSSYLGRSMYWLRKYEEAVNTGDDPLRRGIPEGHWDMCHNCVHLLYAPYLLAALATTDEPVEPARMPDFSAASEEIWLNNPEGRAFSVDATWLVYKRPYFCGVSLSAGWKAYRARHKPDVQVVLLGPDGTVVDRAAADLATGPYGFDGKVKLSAPEGRPGVYRLAIEGGRAFPMRVKLDRCDLRQWVYPLRTGAVSQPNTLYFRTPAQGGPMALRYKLLALRESIETSLVDSAGNRVKQLKEYYDASPPAKWTTWEVDVPADEAGKLWSFRIDPPGGETQEALVRLDGVAAVASIKPERYFVPEPLPAERISEPAPAPIGVDEPVIELEAGQKHSIPRGAKTGERYAHVDPRRGTLEFWVRPDWDPDDIGDMTFVRCGSTRAYRRSQVGTYVALGKGLMQAGVVLTPGVWRHVAVVWDVEAEPAYVRLYLDGVHFGGMYRGGEPGQEDWTGETLDIGCANPLRLTGIRIWDAPQDARLRKGVLSPPADTTALYSSEGE